MQITRHEEFEEETGRQFMTLDEEWEHLISLAHGLPKRQALVKVYNRPVIHIVTPDVESERVDERLEHFQSAVMARCPYAKPVPAVIGEFEERREALALLTEKAKDGARPIGKSKTEAGAGRVIPLNNKATEVLKFWAEQFSNREPEHFVFPSERYGAGGDTFKPVVFDLDPTKPIGSWKEGWETVKEDTGITIRFHDLRHTCVTRMLEGGAPLSVVASILGWSPATTVRMAKRYGHIGHVAQREAVRLLDAKPRRPPKKTKPAPHVERHHERRPS